MRLWLHLVPRAWRESVAGDLAEQGRTMAPLVRPIWVAWRVVEIAAVFAADRLRQRAGVRWIVRWPAEAIRDAHHGLRRWRGRPVFALAAIATIALSTGASTALFSMVDGVLLKPLPYPHADRLVQVNRTYPAWRTDPILAPSWERISLAWPEFFALQHARTLDLLAVRTSQLGLLSPSGEAAARELTVAVVSASYFELFGVRPIAGRFFDPRDDVEDRRVVLLDETLWKTRFGGDPSVLGRPLPLADGTRTIAGIVPASFKIGRWKADLWQPLSVTPASRRVDNDRNLEGVARLRDGVTLRQAEAEIDAMLRASFRYRGETGGRLTSFFDRQVAPVRTALLVLLGGALLLLVMACANVAGFLVGDAASRVHEMRVRAAVGAGRGRVVRQLLVETALLVGAGGVAGGLVAMWGVRGLVALAPASVPRLLEVTLDARVLAFAIASTAAAALLSGTIPAFVLARHAAASGSARVTSSRPVQAKLLVVQLAAGITLLAGAGLFVRTLQNLDRVDVGFARDHLLSARVALPQPLYTRPAQYQQYFERAEAAMAALPGVAAAAVTSGLPFATGRASTTIRLGDDAPGGARPIEAQRRFVSPGYFRVMELPIVAGRGFSPSDPIGGEVFAVVSRDMARRFWNGQALGKHFTQGPLQFVVVGIAGDVRDQTPGVEPMATFYISTIQRPPWPNMRVVARTSLPPAALASEARRALAAIDPAVPIENVETMETLVTTSLADQRYRAVLLGSLAAIAALLAAVGLYGAMARGVADRRREIGVRLALGARPAQVTRLVLGEAGRLVAIGGAIGVLGAIATARVSRQLLYGVGILDGWTLAIVALGAAVIAMAGGYVPARRASRLDPASVLRAE